MSHGPARTRAESLTASRYRSNSNLTSNSDDSTDLIEHPVESRTITAELPPVMAGFALSAVKIKADLCGVVKSR